MYNKVLILYFLIFQFLFSQNVKSIHQQQLEYYNANYIMPERIDTNVVINPISQRHRNPSEEVFGYHPYWVGTAWTSYNFDLISTLAYFSAEVTPTGGLSNLHGWPVASLINEAHEHGTKVVLCATLFNSSDITTLLSSALFRQNLIDNLLYQVQAGNADGVNIDFESFPASQRDNMVIFITDLTEAFHSAIPGSQVTLAMPPVDWSNAWDYNALASISDGLFIMGYNYHYSGSSTTGPNSPLSGTGYNLSWTVNDYLNKTNNQSNKLILGVPYYGYEWQSSSSMPGANTIGVGQAKFYNEMEGLAQSYGKLWHSSSQTTWYNFELGGWNQGWYDDSLSLALKYDHAINNDLKGVGIWALGYDNGRSELWNLLYGKFGDASPPTRPSNMKIKNIGNNDIEIDFSGSENATEFIVIRGYLDENVEDDTIGIYYEKPILLNDLNENETYFFSVIGSNDYGDGVASEFLGVVPSSNPISILIVNGFDRITGTNNTFDFIEQHGSSISAFGRAFDSAANEAIENNTINLMDYQFVNWILGEEGTSTNVLTETEQSAIREYLEDGRFLFISGSEIGYDLEAQGNPSDIEFYQNYLKSNYISDAAGGHQEVYRGFGIDGSIFDGVSEIQYDNGNYGTYDVDWPDGVKPLGGATSCAKFFNTDYQSKGGMGIQYQGNFGLSYKIGGLVYLTVGFETIHPRSVRDELMQRILNFYENQLETSNEININPSTIKITNVYPNPSNNSTTISLFVPDIMRTIELSIKNILGREIYQTNIQPKSNTFSWTWNGTNTKGYNAPTGTYLISIAQSEQFSTKKITLLK